MVGKKLLVADDSLTIQKVIRLALSNEGYEIQTVSDGNQAVQQISLFRPDCVLVDVDLPRKNAFDLKKSISQINGHEHVQFILMASAFEKVDESLENSLGFKARLTKPFDPAHLRKILTEILSAAPPPVSPAPPKAAPPQKASPPQLPKGPPPLSGAPLAPPPMPPTSPPMLDDSLWGEGNASQAPQAANSDIKKLTENTIRLSGLDDFNWSVNESAKKNPEPVQIEETPAHHEPSLPPFPGLHDFGSNTFNILDSTPSIEVGGDAYHEAPGTTIFQTSPEIHSPAPLEIGNHESPATPALSESEMRAMIEKQLQTTLREMAEKILPEVAEKVIRAEIRRMLSESP